MLSCGESGPGYVSGVSWALSGLFFFQAEDGIRDRLVNGVQTCALPIFFKRFVLEEFLTDSTFFWMFFAGLDV